MDGSTIGDQIEKYWKEKLKKDEGEGPPDMDGKGYYAEMMRQQFILN
jgi:hypothetical protein